MSSLAEAWRISAQITGDLLDAIEPEALEDRYSPRTRTVASQFMHLQYWRVKNLSERGPDFLGELRAFDAEKPPTKRQLQKGLRDSARAMGKLVAVFDEGGAVRRWSGPPSTYLGYLVAHEAHHRALAIVSLRMGGHKLPQAFTQGMWYTWRKPRPGD